MTFKPVSTTLSISNSTQHRRSLFFDNQHSSRIITGGRAESVRNLKAEDTIAELCQSRDLFMVVDVYKTVEALIGSEAPADLIAD